MTGSVCRSTLVSLLALLLLAPGASGRQGSPAASTVALDPGPCTVQPRSKAEMRALLKVGLPVIQAYVAGTPISGSSDDPDGDASTGEVAEAEAAAAVTETIEQFIACGNAGQMPAVAATLTNSGAAAYLSFAALSFIQATIGSTTPTAADVDPALIDAFLRFTEVPIPLPADQRVNYYGVRAVTQVADDLFLASLVLSTGTAAAGGADEMLLREVADGGYQILFGTEAIVGDKLRLPKESPTLQATPVP